jgi:hypothetical protein
MTKNFPARTHFADSRRRADKNARAHTNAERYCESGENQQETPCTIQETDLRLPVSNRRGLLGFSGLAPHSGRSSVPFRRSLFWDRRLSFQPAYPHKAEGRTTQGKPPDKTQSIKKLRQAVKLLSIQGSGKFCGKAGNGIRAASSGEFELPARRSAIQLTAFNTIA